MTATAVKLVTRRLSDLLSTALQEGNVPGNVFVGPIDDPQATGATLILFLYRMAPSPSLRNTERRVRVRSENGNETIVLYRNSIPLDLYFLVTVGDSREGREETQLNTLGIVIQSLQENADLIVEGLDGETMRVSLETQTTEEISRIWSLFPTVNYRTSIAYLVSPVWIDPRNPERLGAPVVENTLNRNPNGPGAMR